MVLIRPATYDDAVDIVHIHIESWKAQFTSFLTAEQIKLKNLDEAYQLLMWQGRLTQEEGKTRHTVVATNQDQVIAYVTGRDYDGEYDAELHQIYVMPTEHRQGIGKMLVSALAQALLQSNKQSMIVWVMTINPAVAFYRDSLSGKKIAERIIPEGDGILKEWAFVWDDIGELIS